MKRSIISIALLTMYGVGFATEGNDSTTQATKELENVIVNGNAMLGNKHIAKIKGGSAYYLSPEEIKQYNYSDINRILGKVPGVNVYEEDGFGLRPNISLRGTSPQRTSKITIMEDGVLAAPAPYSAPAAYYFPNAQRMAAIEILKGSSQIQYGPFTTGGAINLLSTPITHKKIDGSIRANYGSFNTFNIHTIVSQNFGQVSYLIEGLKYSSAGFKTIDNLPGANTGFDRNEILGKLKLTTKPTAKYFQSLELKFALNNERANETYLGLAATDYDSNPYRRYASSQLDNIVTNHQQIMATHTLHFSNDMRLTTTAYHNGFFRNWYKLDGVRVGSQRIALSNLLATPAAFPEAFDILRGATSADNALDMKTNNRKYGATGIQTKYDYHFNTGQVLHDVELGLRYHEDYENRIQRVDGYRMVDNTMVLTKEGSRGSDANRITGAKALSGFAMYKMSIKNLTVTPGIRLESINMYLQDYGRNDSLRTGSNLQERNNRYNVLIPGISATYKIREQWNLYAGVHKGFAPSGVDSQQVPETSINTEIGTRFAHEGLYVEGAYYQNNYSNLLGSDLAASGGSGTLDLFNAGRVRVNGIELLANYNILHKLSNNYKLPIEVSYTYTNAIFKSDFKSNEGIWGNVKIGDEMPYIPKHQLYFGLGLEHNKFAIRVNTRYNTGFRTIAGVGVFDPLNSVPAYMVTDFASRYNITDKIAITAHVNNLFNKKYLVAIVPHGLRPGMPMTTLVSIDIKL